MMNHAFALALTLLLTTHAAEGYHVVFGGGPTPPPPKTDSTTSASTSESRIALAPASLSRVVFSGSPAAQALAKYNLVFAPSSEIKTSSAADARYAITGVAEAATEAGKVVITLLFEGTAPGAADLYAVQYAAWKALSVQLSLKPASIYRVLKDEGLAVGGAYQMSYLVHGFNSASLASEYVAAMGLSASAVPQLQAALGDVTATLLGVAVVASNE